MMRAIVMKPFLLLSLLLILPALPLTAAGSPPPKEVTQAFHFWCRAKVPELKLNNNSFEFAFKQLSEEWSRQNGYQFPLRLEDFGPLESVEAGTVASLTMTLKDVPFREAVDLLCAAAGKELKPGAGNFRIEPDDPVQAYGWCTKIYTLSPGLLKILDLGEPPEHTRLATAYTERGLNVGWWQIYLDGDKLLVLASNEDHHRIKFLHELLSKGYTVRRP